jgi:hypothetical protein
VKWRLCRRANILHRVRSARFISDDTATVQALKPGAVLIQKPFDVDFALTLKRESGIFRSPFR